MWPTTPVTIAVHQMVFAQSTVCNLKRKMNACLLCLRFILNLPIVSIGASLKSVVFKSYVCLEYILVFQEIVVLVLFMSQKKILLLCNDDKAPSTYSDY